MNDGWTVNDLEPALEGHALDGDNPVDLTDAASAAVHIRRANNTTVIHPVVLGNQVTDKGSWSHQWVEGDLSVPGGYKAVLRVVWGLARPQSFGSVGFPVAPEIV